MANILVMDDELDLCEIMKKLLISEGHSVDTAENGKIGLKLFDANVYDLVVTDIVMPERDGFEVIKEIRRNSPDVRIIAISGGTRSVDKKLLLPAANCFGATEVIPKPIDYEKFKMVVQELTECRVT